MSNTGFMSIIIIDVANCFPSQFRLRTISQDESVHAVWVHLYKSPEFLELRCDLITEEGFELRGRERMLCDFLGWDDDGCPSPPCPEAPDGVAPSPKTANKTKVKPKRGS